MENKEGGIFLTLDIKKNLADIKNQIKDSASKVGRSFEDIEIIAVTKGVDVDVIEEAINNDINNIAENKVQELIKKYELIGNKVKWHMIGHLQRNKVKYIIDKVELIHSLDSYRLAVEIDKRAKEHNKIMPCLLQINVSEEESKYGISPNEVMDILKKIDKLDNIRIDGLMTMAPYTDVIEKTRKYFKKLKEISLSINTQDFSSVKMKYLSMGMSNDFTVAIEEGANLVRIGSKIFK